MTGGGEPGRGARPDRRPWLGPTARAILGLAAGFGALALAAWGFDAWQERRAHGELGAGRVVIRPHGP